MVVWAFPSYSSLCCYRSSGYTQNNKKNELNAPFSTL